MAGPSVSIAEVTIRQPEGWHARPATEFARIVGESGLDVAIGRSDAPSVRGDSVLSLLTLGAKHGEILVIAVSSGQVEQRDALLQQLIALF